MTHIQHAHIHALHEYHRHALHTHNNAHPDQCPNMNAQHEYDLPPQVCGILCNSTCN